MVFTAIQMTSIAMSCVAIGISIAIMATRR